MEERKNIVSRERNGPSEENAKKQIRSSEETPAMLIQAESDQGQDIGE